MKNQTPVNWLIEKIRSKQTQCANDWQKGYQNALNDIIWECIQAKKLESELLGQIIEKSREGIIGYLGPDIPNFYFDYSVDEIIENYHLEEEKNGG